MRPGQAQNGQLTCMLEECCLALGRTPKDAKDALEILRHEWVDDLQTLAGLSEVGWRELPLPTLLKETLRQRCDELFERVAIPRQFEDPRAAGARARVARPSDVQRPGARNFFEAWQATPQGGRAKDSIGNPWMTEKEFKHPALPVDAKRPQVSGETAKLLHFLRQKLEQSGQDTVQGIGRRFRATDRNNDGIIDRVEFERLLQDFKVAGTTSPEQVQALWIAFDRAKTGFVSYEEFIRTLKGRMNDKREAVVRRVFQALSSGLDASLDRSRCLMYFDPCPQAQISGSTPLEVLQACPVYTSRSAQASTGKPADLSEGELQSYYDNISSLVENDAEFVRMVEETWSHTLKTRAAVWDTEYRRAWDNVSVGADRKPSHCATAICQTMRKQLCSRFQGAEGARRVAAIFWQLTHETNNLSGTFRRLGGSGNIYGGSGQMGAQRYGRPLPEKRVIETLDFTTFSTWLSKIQDELMPELDREILFCVLDNDEDGLVTVNDFFKALRGGIPTERVHVIQKTFALIAGQGVSSIKWGSAKFPQELLTLVGEGMGCSTDSEALSLHDFAEYYLNCSLILVPDIGVKDRAADAKKEADLTSMLMRDWPDIAQALARTTPGADARLIGGQGSIASLSAGVPPASRRPASASATTRPRNNGPPVGFGGNRLGKAMASQAAGYGRYGGPPF